MYLSVPYYNQPSSLPPPRSGDTKLPSPSDRDTLAAEKSSRVWYGLTSAGTGGGSVFATLHHTALLMVLLTVVLHQLRLMGFEA